MRKKWTSEEEDLVRDAYAAGYSVKDIAAVMPHRGESSIVNKIEVMGWRRKPRPPRKQIAPPREAIEKTKTIGEKLRRNVLAKRGDRKFRERMREAKLFGTEKIVVGTYKDDRKYVPTRTVLRDETWVPTESAIAGA